MLKVDFTAYVENLESCFDDFLNEDVTNDKVSNSLTNIDFFCKCECLSLFWFLICYCFFAIGILSNNITNYSYNFLENKSYLFYLRYGQGHATKDCSYRF